MSFGFLEMVSKSGFFLLLFGGVFSVRFSTRNGGRAGHRGGNGGQQSHHRPPNSMSVPTKSRIGGNIFGAKRQKLGAEGVVLESFVHFEKIHKAIQAMNRKLNNVIETEV